MNDAWTRLDESHSLFLIRIEEPHENKLRIVVQASELHPELARDIVFGEVNLGPGTPILPTGPIFEISWPKNQYIAYQVLNESYGRADDSEFTGNHLRIYARSPFLDFLQATSIASQAFPGAFSHYRIFSENHVIDIASQESPEVRILEGDDESVPYSIN